MLNENNMSNAQSLIDNLGTQNVQIKRIKKEAGLIERTENNSERLILTEDNRQVLFG